MLLLIGDAFFYSSHSASVDLIMLSILLILIGSSDLVMTLLAVSGGLLQNYLALVHPYLTVALKFVGPVYLMPD